MSEWFQPGNTPEQPNEGTQPPVDGATPPNDWQANPYRTEPPVPSSAQPPVAPDETPQEQPAEQPEPPAPVYDDGWYRSGPMPPVQDETPAPQPPYTPPTPPTPPKKKRPQGAVIALAIVGIIASVALLVLLVSAVLGTVDDPPLSDEQYSDTDTDKGESVNNNAPSVNISDWADNDGGLSANEIINNNMDSTVVIDVFELTLPSNMYQYGFTGETMTQASTASGIVMTEDGYIITNWHVVIDEETGEEFDRIDVTTYDGKVYEGAEVIGADESTDLAVIKIDAKNLAPAQFGDSSKLVMGARVITLGNAGGLQWSASQGIVSGLARDVYDDTGYSIKCLQTDAAINPGNSGGPLLNNQGQVVGINSAKIAASGYEGLGFSIPINEAKTIIDDLTKYGYVRGRVELGITGYAVNNTMYKGFVISSIAENSSLADTSAQIGDLITAVDDVKVDGYGALRSELAKHKAGDTVKLSLLRMDRTGNTTTLTVTCTLRESKPATK